MIYRYDWPSDPYLDAHFFEHRPSKTPSKRLIFFPQPSGELPETPEQTLVRAPNNQYSPISIGYDASRYMVVGHWSALPGDGQDILQMPLIGSTGTADRAHSAFGCTRRADVCPQVHQGLVEQTGMVFRQQFTGRVRDSSLGSAFFEWLADSEDPGHDSPNIGVYGQDRLAECNAQDCAGGVVSYARQTDEFVPGTWNVSTESFHDLSSRCM
jgi:hypothetical protein